MKFIKRLNNHQVLLQDVHGLDEQLLFELGYEYVADTDIHGNVVEEDGNVFELWDRVDLEDCGIIPDMEE